MNSSPSTRSWQNSENPASRYPAPPSTTGAPKAAPPAASSCPTARSASAAANSPGGSTPTRKPPSENQLRRTRLEDQAVQGKTRHDLHGALDRGRPREESPTVRDIRTRGRL